jgi:hypothetical protein
MFTVFALSLAARDGGSIIVPVENQNMLVETPASPVIDLTPTPDINEWDTPKEKFQSYINNLTSINKVAIELESWFVDDKNMYFQCFLSNIVDDNVVQSFLMLYGDDIVSNCMIIDEIILKCINYVNSSSTFDMFQLTVVDSNGDWILEINDTLSVFFSDNSNEDIYVWENYEYENAFKNIINLIES